MPNNNIGQPRPNDWWNRAQPRPLVDGRFAESGNLPNPPFGTGGLQGHLPTEGSPAPVPGYRPPEGGPAPVPGTPGTNVPTPNTGPFPPSTKSPVVGTLPPNTPPSIAVGEPNPSAPPTNVPPPLPQPTGAPVAQSPEDMINGYIDSLTNRNSAYIQNARRRGLEQAGSRGLLNSSLAAGASERAALEAAQPFVSEMASISKQRENFASQDWLNSNQFNREFAGTLAMLPITNSYQMLQSLFDYALQDPSLYTPEVFSGMSNFFMRNMQDIMSNYFPLGG